MIKRIISGVWKNIKESLKELKIIKKIAMNVIYLFVANIYLMDLMFDKLFDYISSFYKNINKRLQKLLLYLMITLNIIGIYSFYEQDNIVYIEVAKAKETTIDSTEIIEVEDIDKIEDTLYQCNMDYTSCKIKEVAIEYGINYKIAIAIAKHETGNYTSNAYKTKNNVGGMMYYDSATKSSKLMSFETIDSGIEAFVSCLKRIYFDTGLDTVEKIQPIYAPLGAANDPYNLNENWISGVNRFMKEID